MRKVLFYVDTDTITDIEVEAILAMARNIYIPDGHQICIIQGEKPLEEGADGLD